MVELVEQLVPLPDESERRRIFNEFNTNEYQRNLADLKQWFEEETQTSTNANYENQLNIFLRGSKNNVTKAKKRLRNYFLYKEKFPDYFAWHNFNGKFQQFKTYYVLCQPHLTPEGHRLAFLGFSKHAREDFDAEIMFNSIFMIDNLGMCIAHQYFLGIVAVIDLKYASTRHALKVFSWSFRNYMKLLNDVMPFRVHQIFIINVPSYIEKFVWIGKAFLKEKLRPRFFVERSDVEMRKHVPNHLIPCDYGGNAESIDEQCEKWFKLINDLRPWYEDAQRVRVKNDKCKEPTKSATGTITSRHTHERNASADGPALSEGRQGKNELNQNENADKESQNEELSEIQFDFASKERHDYDNAESGDEEFEIGSEEKQKLMQNLDFNRLGID